jgi:hypothetical protein
VPWRLSFEGVQPLRHHDFRPRLSFFGFFLSVAIAASACSSEPSTTSSGDGTDSGSMTDRYLQACIDLCNKEVGCGNVSTDCNILCKNAAQTINPSSCTNADAIVDASQQCVMAACSDLIACEDRIPKCNMM